MVDGQTCIGRGFVNLVHKDVVVLGHVSGIRAGTDVELVAGSGVAVVPLDMYVTERQGGAQIITWCGRDVLSAYAGISEVPATVRRARPLSGSPTPLTRHSRQPNTSYCPSQVPMKAIPNGHSTWDTAVDIKHPHTNTAGQKAETSLYVHATCAYRRTLELDACILRAFTLNPFHSKSLTRAVAHTDKIREYL